jgi:hypothetical protein
MAAFLDNCRFLPTAGGTTDFTYLSAVGGCQSPSAAGAVNGVKYKCRAESADLTQWEIFEGAYNSSTGTFPRTTVLYNSAATGITSGQSGAGAKVNFATVPQVAVIGIKEDLISIEEANSFTAAQQVQARTNINAASLLRTRTVFASGSGTYSTPAGCKVINVRMIGGGGGGGEGPTAGGGSSGGSTTFGSLVAGGGATGVQSGGVGGGASGGDINIQGGGGQGGVAVSQSNTAGGRGGDGPFGGGGIGTYNGPGGFGAPNTGGGGGGGGVNNSSFISGGGGGAGGYCEKLIVNPGATVAFAVGAGGTGAPQQSSGFAGGNGGSGMIIIDEYY